MKTENENPNTPKKKVNWKKVLIAAGITGVVVAGVFVYAKTKKNSTKKKDETDFDNDTVPYTPSLPAPKPEPYSPSVTDTSSISWLTPSQPEKSEFPLKQGSKGQKVRDIQNYINYKFGAGSIKVDGDWGPATQKALIKFGLPTVIDESTYNVFAKAGAPSTYSVGTVLFSAVNLKDYSKAIAELKKLRNTNDYSEANEQFKNLNWLDKKGIADKMLSVFSTTSQRDAINYELLRIGLKYNGSSWALAGIVKLIITKEPTFVLDYPDKQIKVANKIILGSFIEERNGYTLFATLNGKHKLLVKTESIQFL